MRIYANLDEMHSETERNLHSLGIVVKPQTMQDKFVAGNADYETLELSPHEFTVLQFADRNEWLTKLGGNLDWAVHEFQERARITLDRNRTGPNPGSAWKKRATTWKEFLHGRPPKFSYSYGERLGMKLVRSMGRTPRDPAPTAIRQVADLLIKDSDTRQAILPVFCGPLDLVNVGGQARIPCSLHYQFLIRENELRMIYVMRSSDFYTHFMYDIWLAMELQSLMAAEIGIEVGRFTFFTGSLHIYRKDSEPGVF